MKLTSKGRIFNISMSTYFDVEKFCKPNGLYSMIFEAKFCSHVVDSWSILRYFDLYIRKIKSFKQTAREFCIEYIYEFISNGKNIDQIFLGYRKITIF